MVSSKMQSSLSAAKPRLSLLVFCLLGLIATGCNRTANCLDHAHQVGHLRMAGQLLDRRCTKKGWFVEAGIVIDRIDVGGKYFAAQDSLATGAIDAMGFTQFDLVQHVAHGQDLVGIAAIDYSEGAEALVARHGIRTLQDLYGKRLALHRGSYLEYLLSVLAEREGVDLAKINLVDSPGDLSAEEFKQGKVDAVLVWEPWVAEAQKLGNTNIVFSTRDFPGLTYSVLTFRRDFINAHPREIAALMEVWHRAERYIHDNPEESCQIVADAFGEPDVNDIRVLMRADRVLDLADNGRAFSYAAGFESLHASWRRMNDFLLERGLVDKRVASPVASGFELYQDAPIAHEDLAKNSGQHGGTHRQSLMVVSVALYLLMKHHTEELVVARFEDSLVPTSRAVDNLVLDALRGMYLLVSDRSLREDQPNLVIARLRSITYVYPYIGRIYLADPAGKILASSEPSDVGRSAFDSVDLRPHFASILKRPLGSIEVVNIDGGADIEQPVFRLLTQIRDPAGQHPRCSGIGVAERTLRGNAARREPPRRTTGLHRRSTRPCAAEFQRT